MLADIEYLKLKSSEDPNSPITSRITISAATITHQDATRRLVGNAQAATIQQLDPNSPAGKVWHLLGRLDVLSGIISKIDQVAKVGYCWCYNLLGEAHSHIVELLPRSWVATIGVTIQSRYCCYY